MKKNVRDYKNVGVQYAYVLDAIDATDFGRELTTDEERIEFFWEQFDNWDCEYERRYHPNLQERVAWWLQGLPSGIHIAFSNYDIIQTGKSWGYCQTEKKEDEFVDRWFSVIALRYIQLRDKLSK